MEIFENFGFFHVKIGNLESLLPKKSIFTLKIFIISEAILARATLLKPELEVPHIAPTKSVRTRILTKIGVIWGVIFIFHIKIA